MVYYYASGSNNGYTNSSKGGCPANKKKKRSFSGPRSQRKKEKRMYWGRYAQPTKNDASETTPAVTKIKKKKNNGRSSWFEWFSKDEHARRTLISNLYICHFNAPPPLEWKGKGNVVAELSRLIGIPEGSSRLVQNVISDTWNTLTSGIVISLERKTKITSSQKYKIQPGSSYKKLACDHLETGCSPSLVADILNLNLKEDKVETRVSKSCIA